VITALVVAGAAVLGGADGQAGPLPGASTALAADLPAPRPGPARAAVPAVVPAVVPAAAPAAAPARAPAAGPAPAGDAGGPATKTPSRAKPTSTPKPTTTRTKMALVADTPCTVTAKACVDIADGRAWLLANGAVTRGPVHIMTGDQDDPTPIGRFTVQWKAEQYTSRQYLVQMPYSVFFADGGIAFHEGRQDTASGGCVKLGHDDAVAWFAYLQVGDEVQVH
jgi:lipoprotein-anchoring transpeptidase ErfK/SrfK